jgi:hypothetical protein
MPTTADVPFNLNDDLTWTPTAAGAEAWNRWATRDVPAYLLAHVKLATAGQPMRVQAWEFISALGSSITADPQLVEGFSITIHARTVATITVSGSGTGITL